MFQKNTLNSLESFTFCHMLCLAHNDVSVGRFISMCWSESLFILFMLILYLSLIHVTVWRFLHHRICSLCPHWSLNMIDKFYMKREFRYVFVHNTLMKVNTYWVMIIIIICDKCNRRMLKYTHIITYKSYDESNILQLIN